MDSIFPLLEGTGATICCTFCFFLDFHLRTVVFHDTAEEGQRLYLIYQKNFHELKNIDCVFWIPKNQFTPILKRIWIFLKNPSHQVQFQKNLLNRFGENFINVSFGGQKSNPIFSIRQIFLKKWDSDGWTDRQSRNQRYLW